MGLKHELHCALTEGSFPVCLQLAYMWWMRDFRLLEDANEVLQAGCTLPQGVPSDLGLLLLRRG